jgi:Ca2+-binding EF-hand superfamily protein
MHQSQAHAAAVSRLRSYLKLNRGHRAGCLKLLDAMLQHDSMNTGILNWKEFSHALTSSGCQIQDVKVLYQFEIKDENGCINIQNFLEMIKNKLSKQKEELIIEVFYNSIDRDADGIVSINDILSNYVVDQHPDVKIGRKSAETILHDLSNDLAFFSQDGYYNIKSFTSFIDYIYSFEDDVDFHELVTSLWIQPQPHAKIDNVASSISSQGFGSSLLHAKEVFVDKIRKCLRVRGLKGCCTLKTSLLKRGGR